MKTKGDHPSKLIEGEDLPPVIRTYYALSQLKRLLRQGWLRCDVPAERCESVAEHSFAVAILALFLARDHFPELDAFHVAKMALLHELGEIGAGDITPFDGISPDEKERRERESMIESLRDLPGAEEYRALWEEFEAGETPEARFVNDIDKLEMGLQAALYEREGLEGLDHFFESSARLVSSPVLRALIPKSRRPK